MTDAQRGRRDGREAPAAGAAADTERILGELFSAARPGGDGAPLQAARQRGATAAAERGRAAGDGDTARRRGMTATGVAERLTERF